MVAFQACGGLGNQLFQYAFARALADRNGSVTVADPSWYLFGHTGTKREFELLKYPVTARFPTQDELNHILMMLMRPAEAQTQPMPFTLVRERESFKYDPAVYESPENSYFVGYWQAPKYFDSIRERLLVEFSPVAEMSPADKAISDQIADSNSIAIHVRRGDYVTWLAATQFHGTCSVEYYHKAFDILRERIGTPKLFIFSDDTAWTRENLRFDAETVYVDHNGPENAFQDLRLMSLCRHFIIANSTFSWWGAWLGTYAGKLVCAPSRWCANDPQPANLLPDDWIRI